MTISKKDQNILWGRAAGRCALPDCRKELVKEKSGKKAIVGEMAHIVAKKDDGPRGDPSLSLEFKDSYENLVLLCPTHHTLIDKYPEIYTVNYLYDIKNLHEAWVRENLKPIDPHGIGWKVIILEEDWPIDESKVIESLLPDYPDGEIIKLRITKNQEEWSIIKEEIKNLVNKLLIQNEYQRFAVFAIVNVSSAIYLGYLLTSRVNIRYSQYNRDLQSWEWSSKIDNLPDLCVNGLEKIDPNHKEAIIMVSLSVKILHKQIDELNLSEKNRIEITTPSPSEDWLESERQLIESGRIFREILSKLRLEIPDLNLIHLFYAGPTSGGIGIGRQINPKMNPPIYIYEFNRIKKPNYKNSIILNETQNEY